MKKLISIILASFVAITAFAAEKSIPAVMLQDDGTLFIEEDGQMNYKMSIPAGSELEVLTVKNENGVVVPELKKSKRIISEKLRDCECYHVKYNNKPYWCLPNRIGLNEKIGIIVKDTAVYRSPDVCDIKEKSSLAVGTVISFGDAFVANNKFKLLKITYYDPANYEVYTGYVKQEKVSSSKDDYKGIKIIKSIKKILKDGEKADKGLLEENYKNFKHLSTSPAITQMCDELVNSVNQDESDTSNEAAALREAEPFSYYGALVVSDEEDSNINIRDYPSTENSKVVGQFKFKGGNFYEVNVTYRSASTDIINGDEEYWYYISNDTVSGWIFGSYLVFSAEDEGGDYDYATYDGREEGATAPGQ